MKNKNTILVFITLLLLTISSRWVSHIWNFTLLGGAFLFAGAFFQDKKISVLLMLSSMLISDFIIGFHDQMLSVYLSYLIIVSLGFFLLPNSSRLRILSFSVLGSLSFYVLTNFAVWYQGELYPLTFDGLINCFTMAIPFYRNQILSDVISSVAIFEAVKLMPGLVLVPNAAEVKTK